jgi:hypothetical protein
VHTLSLGANYAASDKLNLYLNAIYNLAEAEMDGVYLSEDKANFTPDLSNPGDVTLIGSYAKFDDEGRITKVENYSDLEYTQIELALGGQYDFSEEFYMTAQAGVDFFDDAEEYVYGDQDGTVYSGYLGFGYKF